MNETSAVSIVAMKSADLTTTAVQLALEVFGIRSMIFSWHAKNTLTLALKQAKSQSSLRDGPLCPGASGSTPTCRKAQIRDLANKDTAPVSTVFGKRTERSERIIASCRAKAATKAALNSIRRVAEKR